MQARGHPVERQIVIAKASELARKLGTSIGDGWYKRFCGRHPELTSRMAQVVSRVRNEVDQTCVEMLFDTMERVIDGHRLNGSRIFNIDETSFQSRKY